MSDNVITINSQPFATGLEWSDHGSNAKEAKRLLAKSKSKSYVLVKTKTSDGELNVLGRFSGRAPRNTIPAGLAIGAQHPNCLIVHEEQDGRWWVVSIISGTPGAGYDTWMDREGAQQEVKTAIQSGIADIIGEVPGAKKSLHEALQEFVEQREKGVISKKRAAEMTLRPKPSALGPLLPLILVVSLAGGGFATWKLYEKQLREAAAKKRKLSDIALTQAQEREREAAKQALIAKFRNDVATKRAELEQLSYDGMTIWETWSKARKGMPVSFAGFRPEQLECDRQKCAIQWVAAGPLVSFNDYKHLPNVVSGQGTLSPRSEFELQVPASPRGELVGAEYQQLLALTQFSAPGATFEQAAPVTVNPPPDLGLTPETVGFQGKFTYQAPAVGSLVMANDTVKLLSGKGVFLKKAIFTGFANGPGSVQLEGGYVSLQPKQP